MTPRILLIYTGGTIGMVSDPVTGALKPLNFKDIATEIPALRKLNVEIDYCEDFDPIDSSDVTPQMWVRLAEVLRDNYEKYDGFVVLHGTDTMAWSASALGFMLENLAKPVVFTGSQIPIGVLRTDGRENLVTAVEIAASNKIPEVSIYFQNRLFRANRTTKWSAEQLNAFTSENFPPLAEVGVSITYHPKNFSNEKPQPLEISTALCLDVALIKIFPGMRPETLKAMLSIPGLKGVVLQTFGAGNTPTEAWFFEAIEEAIARGVAIVNITQCIGGGVKPIYESGVKLARMGVASGHDMTTEAALTKLMYVLGKNGDVSTLSQPLRGELTV